MIEILTTGAVNTVQDDGRHGRLSTGIGRCGAMDRLAFDLANALLGNPPEAAALEVALFPFRLRFLSDTRFAVAGAEARATLDGRPVPPGWTRRAGAGQVLALAAPRRGARAIVAFAGGLDVPLVMGSRATDLKGGFGGHEGRGLRRGDRLALGPAGPESASSASFGASLPPGLADAGDRPLRCLPAAEYDAFDAASRAAFVEDAWTVGREANRMGYRLAGPTLALTTPRELYSHGILPGVVQVPANGQPIIQLADANTCGGYPKIAGVIEADLWRIAQTPVGARLRFVLADATEAVAALRLQAAWLTDVRAAAAHEIRRG